VPWSQISPMSQREEFIQLYLQRRHTVRELCDTFGVSEKTGYKWLRRFLAGGSAGLADRSHAPHCPSHRTSSELVARIVTLRREHPTWGPRKLRQRLITLEPTAAWPAASTIGALLKRAGLVRRGRRVRGPRWAPLDVALTEASAPNEVWTADFKGEFRLRQGAWCYPLTVADAFSRFLLRCTALPSTRDQGTSRVFERLFEEYGLPQVIRTDNGVPFAAPLALARLSRLAVWWIRLGIRPERIAPGKPQQNGQHERMHRTLKDEATRPAASTWREQQLRFDRFRLEYNTERPHEALHQQTPASCYLASPRTYPRRLPPMEYPARADVRLVHTNGTIKWRQRLLPLTTVLAGEYVALEEHGPSELTIRFGPLILGTLNDASETFTPGVCWQFNPVEPPDLTSPIIPV
jgi:putative transposase